MQINKLSATFGKPLTAPLSVTLGTSLSATLGATLSESLSASFLTSFQPALPARCEDVVPEDDHVVQMAVVVVSLGRCHAVNLQFLPRLVKAWRRGVVGDFRCVEEIDPLLQRHLTPLVEIVDLQDEILGIEVADGVHLEPLLLER